MDTMTLRWALVVVGVMIIIALFLFGNPDKKRKPRASRKRVHAQKVRHEPQLSSSESGEAADEKPGVDQHGVDGYGVDEYGVDGHGGDQHGVDERQTELAIEPLEPMGDLSDPGAGGRREPRFGFDNEKVEPGLEAGSLNQPKSPASDVPLPDKIITLFIKARDNHIISGVELLDVSLKSGLVFGDPGIFHRLNEEDGKPVFSMANLTNPGIFDKTEWNTIEILGVTMFMTLPGPKNALDAWDSMLATSRRLAELLHADLLDDQRQIFGRQRSLQIKEELREFERHKAEQT